MYKPAALIVGLVLLASSCGGSSSSAAPTGEDATTTRPTTPGATSTSTLSGPPVEGVVQLAAEIAVVSNPPSSEMVVTVEDGAGAVAITDHPGIEGGLLLVERWGHVLEVVDGEFLGTPWLDLRDRIESESTFERGLLGLAIDEDRSHAYVSFTDLSGDSNLLSFALDTEGRPVLESERLILFQEQPGETHNAGTIHIDSAGLLWMSLGDGGGGDPRWNAQDTENLLGSIIRIRPTPEGDEPYTIPDANPFLGVGGFRPEIYVYGLRNPWRFDVDEETGDLWIGDVGEADYEELDLIRADQTGANLGWPYREGSHLLEGDPGALELTDPYLEYDHAVVGGCSMIAGGVVRGRQDLVDGAFLFADLCSRWVYVFDPSAAEPEVEKLIQMETEVTSLQVIDGEIYVMTRKPGALHMLR